MPRQARDIRPGTLVHVICRIVNRDYLIASDVERAEYLRRFTKCVERVDWTPLYYCMMSTHTHLASIAGSDPLEALMKPLNTGFAKWLNERTGRLGHVFADRPAAIVVEDDHAGVLLPYIGNNPVRAGVVTNPLRSSWTSHRYFLDPRGAPTWLDVERGLAITGFDNTASGRAAFHELTLSRSGLPRDEALSGESIAELRTKARAESGAPIEIGSPVVSEDTVAAPIVMASETSLRPRWELEPSELVSAVAAELRVSVDDVRSKSRRVAVSAARRLAMIVWVSG